MNSSRSSLTFPLEKAEEIIKNLQIREPSEIQIRDISMVRGVYVKEKTLEGSEARLLRKGNIGIITVNNRIPEEGRKRFAIAHELGHFELHTVSQLVVCAEEDMYVWNENKKQEFEANEFAASILMPTEIFTRHFDAGPPNIEIVKDLSGKFRTTLTATILRYVQLSSEPCAVAITKNGIIKWYKKSPSFEFHVRVGEKLSPIMEDLHSHGIEEVSTCPTKVPASAWLTGVKNEEALMFEQSIALRSYGVILSLLWICNEIKSSHRRYDEDEPEFDLTNPITPDGKRWRW